MRSRFLWMPAALLLWASCPGRASAHLVNSGLGPFYDGVAHLFVTPEDILVVVAVALLAGRGGNQCGRAALFLLPLAWLVGGLVGRTASSAAGLPILNAITLVASGALVAAASDRWLSRRIVAGFAVMIGFLHGFLNGAALAEPNYGGPGVGGIVCAAFVVVALVAGQVASLRKEWAPIAVRVAGSWIGAIGLLMLGWAAR